VKREVINQMASRLSRGEFNEDFGQGFQKEFEAGYCFAQQTPTKVLSFFNINKFTRKL
jgi:hypothetical protein